jgi:hypothetical protein
MSVSYNTSIITSGITLYLDAANKKSYPGTGTSWFDLSGNNQTFTINGPVTYKSENNGYLEFNSSTEYTQSNSALTLATNNITVDLWVRVYTHGDWNDFVSNNWVNNGWLMFAGSTAWSFGIAKSNSQYIASSIHNNSTSWTNLIGTYDGSTVRLYVNGVVSSTTASLAAAILDTNYVIRVAQQGDPGAYDISTIKVYNRALSASEAYQNFNALRGRYGL